MRRSLGIIVVATALCAGNLCAAQTECVRVSGGARSLARVVISNECAEPVTVALFTAQGTEVVNVPAKSRLGLTMLKVRRWRACRGVSVVDCPQSNWAAPKGAI